VAAIQILNTEIKFARALVEETKRDSETSEQNLRDKAKSGEL
jgi:hypothetical protein